MGPLVGHYRHYLLGQGQLPIFIYVYKLHGGLFVIYIPKVIFYVLSTINFF